MMKKIIADVVDDIHDRELWYGVNSMLKLAVERLETGWTGEGLAVDEDGNECSPLSIHATRWSEAGAFMASMHECDCDYESDESVLMSSLVGCVSLDMKGMELDDVEDQQGGEAVLDVYYDAIRLLNRLEKIER